MHRNTLGNFQLISRHHLDKTMSLAPNCICKVALTQFITLYFRLVQDSHRTIITKATNVYVLMRVLIHINSQIEHLSRFGEVMRRNFSSDIVNSSEMDNHLWSTHQLVSRTLPFS